MLASDSPPVGVAWTQAQNRTRLYSVRQYLYRSAEIRALLVLNRVFVVVALFFCFCCDPHARILGEGAWAGRLGSGEGEGQRAVRCGCGAARSNRTLQGVQRAASL